jgi:hypothetical protein
LSLCAFRFLSFMPNGIGCLAPSRMRS